MTAMSEEPGQGHVLKKIALATLLGLIILFAFGVLAGVGYALLDGDGDANPAGAAIAVAIAALIGLAALWGLLRLKPWAGSGEPIAPGTRKANNLLLLSGALGGLLGGAMSISMISMEQPFGLFSNDPMPVALVIPALAIWLLLMPLISWQWHRSIDEHEAAAYRSGGMVALYLYGFLTPAWWLAWRGGLVPAPDAMLIYIMVVAVWCVAWFRRKWQG